MTEKSGAMQVDAALVRQLAELLDETKLTEIEVQDGERRIKVARKAAQVMNRLRLLPQQSNRVQAVVTDKAGNYSLPCFFSSQRTETTPFPCCCSLTLLRKILILSSVFRAR